MPNPHNLEERIKKELHERFVKINTKEMGDAIGINLNNEILFHGKVKELEEFISNILYDLKQKIERMRKFVGKDGITYDDEVEKIGYNTALSDVLDLFN